MSSDSIYRIGNYTFDLKTNLLFAMEDTLGENAIKLEPRILKVLEILIRQSPEVVTRSQLIEEVWDNYGGAEDALNHAVSQLRKVLNDTNKDDRIIETLPKKGYRLRKLEQPKSTFNWDWKSWALMLLTILFLAFLTYQFMNKEKPLAPPAPEGKVMNETVEMGPVPQPNS
jgi:DNA-binding winged helix-turn-helix (wHTH) protein